MTRVGNLLFHDGTLVLKPDGYSRWGICGWCMEPVQKTDDIMDEMILDESHSFTDGRCMALMRHGWTITYHGLNRLRAWRHEPSYWVHVSDEMPACVAEEDS